MKLTKIFYLFALILVSLCCSCSEKIESIEGTPEIKLSATEINTGEYFTYRITGVDSSDIWVISWDYGDESTATLFLGEYTYNYAGVYTITASVTLRNKEIRTCSATVTVNSDGTTTPDDGDDDEDDGEYSLPATLSEALYDKDHIMVCAHRGYWSTAPQNSILSIEEAIANKIEMVELDVRLTSDNQLVLMHDSTIDATTNGSGTVANMTYAQLSQYYLYDGDGSGELTSQRIPLFSEALAAAKGKIFVDVDLKIDSHQLIYNAVKDADMLDQVMYTPYSTSAVSSMLGIDNTVILLPVIYEMDDLTTYMEYIPNFRVVQFNSDAFTTDVIAKAQDEEIEIFKNVYVNTTTTPTSDSYLQVRAVISAEGRIIQTDHPSEVRTYLDNYVY